MIAECCDTALPGGLLLAPCIVGYDKDSKVVGVELQNVLDKPVTIPSNIPLCSLQSVKDVGFISNLDSSTEVSAGFLNLFDLSDAKEHLAPEDVNKLNDLLVKWENVFSKNDKDLGRTSLVKHQINLTDETPIKQRHHRIPPGMYEEVKKHLR
jgi:hypothetical protein